MDASAIITVITGATGILGGYVGGKRLGNQDAIQSALALAELQQARIDALEESLSVKNEEVADLRARVDILEEMVTQRAEVEAVRVEVAGVRTVVDKIAVKVGA